MNTSSVPNDEKIKKEEIEDTDVQFVMETKKRRNMEQKGQEAVSIKKNRLQKDAELKKEAKPEPAEEAVRQGENVNPAVSVMEGLAIAGGRLYENTKERKLKDQQPRRADSVNKNKLLMYSAVTKKVSLVNEEPVGAKKSVSITDSDHLGLNTPENEASTHNSLTNVAPVAKQGDLVNTKRENAFGSDLLLQFFVAEISKEREEKEILRKTLQQCQDSHSTEIYTLKTELAMSSEINEMTNKENDELRKTVQRYQAEETQRASLIEQANSTNTQQAESNDESTDVSSYENYELESSDDETSNAGNIGTIRGLVCSDCNIKCVSNSVLQAHYRRHTGKRPFACDHCDLKFKRACDRAAHIRKAHKREKPYECAKCEKKFATLYDLNMFNLQYV